MNTDQLARFEAALDPTLPASLRTIILDRVRTLEVIDDAAANTPTGKTN